VSTLADPVGSCTTVLQPVYELIERHVLAAERCMATIPPCRSWPSTRPSRGTSGPMCATTGRSADAPRPRRSITPRAIAGMSILPGTFTASPVSCRQTPTAATTSCTPRRPQGPITAALCWAHARRQFFELADIAANARRGKNAVAISPIALEAVKRIDALFDIERTINGQSADERLRVRREHSASPLAALEA
jgi:transposase